MARDAYPGQSVEASAALERPPLVIEAAGETPREIPYGPLWELNDADWHVPEAIGLHTARCAGRAAEQGTRI